MNDDIRGSSHIRPEDRRSSHARSMHVPATSSSAATGEARPLEPPNAYPWQSTVNGDGSLDQSQSSDSSKRRSSQSPSAQGSGSQTSLTTVTSELSSTANGTSAQHAAKDIPLQISAGTTAFQSQGPHGLSSVVENGIEDTQHAGHKSVGLSELHDRPLSKASSQSPSKGRSAELTQGHKRTASGDIKPTTETKELHNPARRQRSTSIDSSRGNRVAEVCPVSGDDKDRLLSPSVICASAFTSFVRGCSSGEKPAARWPCADSIAVRTRRLADTEGFSNEANSRLPSNTK